MSLYRNAVFVVKGFREFTRSGFQSASKSFNPTDLDHDISQRSYMITGANSGVGKTTALVIAQKGGTVHMICRNKERGEAALQELKEVSGNENIHLHLVDMSKPGEIKAFSDSFKEKGQPLHVLINNAGVLIPDETRQMTSDGFEMTFATNTLGVHCLTLAMMPLLEAQEDSRVIIVTSGGMLVSKLDLSDLQSEKMTKFDGTFAYSQTKRQETVMTSQYAKLYNKIHFSCMHPGWSDTPGVQSSLPDFHKRLEGKLRTQEEGADTIIWLAISPSVTKHSSGLFFQDRRPVPVHLPLAWTKSNSGDEDKLITTLDDMWKKFC